MIVTTMRLVEVGTSKILAGHAADGESVFVLRKKSGTDYELHQIDIDDRQQSLRSFLSVDQSTESELVNAILQTSTKQKRKSVGKRKCEDRQTRRTSKRKQNQRFVRESNESKLRIRGGMTNEP